MSHTRFSTIACLLAALLLVPAGALAQIEDEMAASPDPSSPATPPSGSATPPSGGDAATPSSPGGTDPGVEAYISAIHQAVAADRIADVTQKADTLKPVVEGSDVASKTRIACWLDKVKDPSVDDRLVEWSRICPSHSSDGLMSDARCNTTAVQRDMLLEMLKDPTKFEDADRALNLTAHVRSLVLVFGSGGRTANAPQDFDKFELDVRTAAAELAKVPSDSRSLHYLALKQWVAAKRQDPKSLYNLCPLGG